MSQRVLVLGSGGREHVLCWKLSQSHDVSQIYCAPGNGGTAVTSKTQNIPIGVMDFDALLQFAQQNQIDLTVVGPDDPLAAGIVDAFEAAGLRIFGPRQAAARLESSKVFAKQFMGQHHLPTAPFAVFDNARSAYAFCQQNDWARVIKVDGLALGKGVFVCDTLTDCQDALNRIFTEARFGTAGAQVVVESRLHGPEISLLTFFDGKTLLPLASSQDYKRRFDNQIGPNTGGMGAYSPVPAYQRLQGRVEHTILQPLAKALVESQLNYKGVLFIGLMIDHGEPYILEFNARFGDPETQCLLPRLNNDLLHVLQACITGTLDAVTLDWLPQACTSVVLCADTYPEKGSQGEKITIGALPADTWVLHAGTQQTPSGDCVTQGGRVLNVVSLAESPAVAAQKSYEAIQSIHFKGMAYRSDIAKEVALCLSS